MVKHTVFGVERDIDIPSNVFPTQEEIQKVEDKLPGCQHGWFPSVVDGAQLHYRFWLPTTTTTAKPKAILIFLHGVLAHGGKVYITKDGRHLRTRLLADVCVQQEGYALYTMDMYGHGFSEGVRFLIPGWKNNMQDYINFCKLVASKHNNDKDIPIFLMGDSFGGTLTLHVGRKFLDDPSLAPPNFDSIILDAPAIMGGNLPSPPVVFVLRHLLAPAFPKWRPFFMPNPTNPECMWRDPEVREYYTSPQVTRTRIDGSGMPFRLGTAVNLLEALEAVREEAIPGYNGPFCILHGTNDIAVPIKGSELLWEKAATPPEHKVFHRIDGAHHDLLADFKAEECVGHVVAWINKRLAERK